MNGLDLFTGIGGITLALRGYVTPVAYCEIEPYCQSVLLQRMSEGNLPKAPIWDDVRTLPASELPRIDIIYGGSPCQDLSVAGRKAGLDGERSGLFFEIVRLAEELRPTFLFLENVPGIRTRGLDRVLQELTKARYDCRWTMLSAAEVGALHRRERWFLLAHACSERCDLWVDNRKERHFQDNENRGFKEIQPERDERKFRFSEARPILAHAQSESMEGQRGSSVREKTPFTESALYGENDGNANSITSEQTNQGTITKQSAGQAWRGHSGQYWPFESRADWQETCGRVRRVSNGDPHRVFRLKALGNGVVPVQVRTAFEILLFGKAAVS
jgi:DNA (cytosine-5)-methyltransferase 1